MFADDMVIIGNSREDLQHRFNLLYEYCKTWGLEVNMNKTKIMVFRNRGKLLPNEKWFYNNNEVVIVDYFNFLGVFFNYTGTFALN